VCLSVSLSYLINLEDLLPFARWRERGDNERGETEEGDGERGREGERNRKVETGVEGNK